MSAETFWEDFEFDYIFDSQDVFSELVSIEGNKQAALNLILPPEWRRQLNRLNRIRAVHGTTALEGNPLSEAEVDRQIEIIDQEGDSADETNISIEQLQIRNSARAQEWVRNRFQPGSPHVGLGDILTMHRLVTEGSDEAHNIPGTLRTFPVTVGTIAMGGVHKGSPHESLSELMEEFVSFLGSKKFNAHHPVVRALLAHFFLVTIHPFGDGNGRVSRLLEAGILFQGEYNVHGFYGLSNHFYANEQEYKSLLQECRRRKPLNVSGFVKFGAIGFKNELAGINNFVKTKLNRVIYRQMLVRNYNLRTGVRRRLLNVREYQLLDFLLNATEPLDPFSERPSRRINLSELEEYPLIKSIYRNVTPRTFHRELTRLAEIGMIKFQRDNSSKSQIIELDFDAISKYQIS